MTKMTPEQIDKLLREHPEIIDWHINIHPPAKDLVCFKIKICCDAMGDTMMMNDIRESITMIEDKLYIWWKDGDCMPLNYCPSCGKKIEKVKE